MLQRLFNVGVQGNVSKFTPTQIANRGDWTGVPDRDAGVAALHTVRMVPRQMGTITFVNPLDPASVGPGWVKTPCGTAPVIPAGNTNKGLF